MAEKSKLFDYNTSFLVTRTNPLLTGNIKITVDSSGGAYLNSINANQTLSSDKFKNYKINGNNSYSTDLYEFLDEGNLKPEILFDVSKKTEGEKKSSDDYSLQYDFFYGSGASTLVDKNYDEPFSYFAPLWLKNELPEFFVIFKTPNPISYPYSTNVDFSNIEDGKEYKVIQDPDGEAFSVSYGSDSFGNPQVYEAGSFFTGDNLGGNEYSIIAGEGKVSLMEELKFQDKVNDVENYFNDKILNDSSVIETFDLREGTLIGDYIRSIINDKSFPKGPIDINFGENSYTYYHGVDYKNGIYSKAGELLYDYFKSPESTPMIDFESYITEGFSRNGIISSNIINLEFAFDDKDSDLYSINRYFGMYVSRNDLGNFRMDGNSYYINKDSEGNNNLPKPRRNNVGYYFNNTPYEVTSNSGVRLYYENSDGWVPGSDDSNINDKSKLYYITDKNEKFHSLKRIENYDPSDKNYSYGSLGATGFTNEGNLDESSGNLVISDSKTDLLNFTGVDKFLASLKVIKLKTEGYDYTEIKFNKIYDLPKAIAFKLFWSGGIYSEGDRKFDLIYSGDYSGVIEWIKGSFSNFGGSRVFNPYSGNPSDIANSFSSLVRDFAGYRLDSASVSGSSILRTNVSGENINADFSISVFYDYPKFAEKYLGLLDPEFIYSDGDIVIDSSDNYLEYISGDWVEYKTFQNDSGYGSIKDLDFSEINSNISFSGGTSSSNNRIAFSKTDDSIIKVGNYIQTDKGFVKILSIDRLVDYAVEDETGVVTGFKNYELLRVANLENIRAIPKLGSDSKVSVFEPTSLNVGVFTFFDIKDFDFDFWSSNYSNTPLAETNRYYYIKAGQKGIIKTNIPYYVKSGSIRYNNIFYNSGDVFEGVSGIDFFVEANKGFKSIVVAGPYTQLEYTGPGQYGDAVKYEANLELFSGFYGIEAIDDIKTSINESKFTLFNVGKLNTEYEYLNENYNIETSNISRIVPYINKWSLAGGTDARGNPYRLNSSPAFSPTNFSPSIDREEADPSYLTHEGYILESLPTEYPIEEVNNQKNYLPEAPDYNILLDADPENASYFSSIFTVSSLDYPGDYSNASGLTKEFFGTFSYDESGGFYEVVFRGVKYVIKKKSNLTDIGKGDPRNFISNYRGYEGYRFTSILKVVSESNDIQPPVKYEILENTTQKSITFLITVVIEDYRLNELSSFRTKSSSVVDYTLLYSLSDKKKLYLNTNSLQLNKIDSIKLSVGLDLSYSSDSFVDSIISPGRVYIIENPEYDTDLREEIKLTYSEGSNKNSTSEGSFSVPGNSSTYPWPIGISKNFIEFGKLDSNYSFDIPFLGLTGGVSIPAGSKALYNEKPVYQVDGGEGYFPPITSRISMGQIAKRINSSDSYIKYKTYSWDTENLKTVVTEDQFILNIESPTYYRKQTGVFSQTSTEGPQKIGKDQITSYSLQNSLTLKSDMLRFSGFYEPIARKVIMFNNDKLDFVTGDPSKDLSFRNTTFGSNKSGFGKIKNLNYTKVSFDENILSDSKDLPEGPVYPLIDETPIDRKDFPIFQSSWDPGYYNLYTTTSDKTPVAGTRSMKETKSFFGSKIMKTPDNIRINNFIGMEVSKFEGDTNINFINTTARKSSKAIQNLTQTQNASGIGQIPKVFVGVDITKMDEDIFPDVEVFWQNTVDPFKQDEILYVAGVIRMDRMLKRYLLNSGVEKDFVNHIISEYGVGDPSSIEDDILEYIDLNVVPIFESNGINVYIKSLGSEFEESNLSVRGDILPSYRSRTGYISDKNFTLTKRSDLIFEFDYRLNPSEFTSINFSFNINKI